jgi:hypothetical protein
MKIKYQNLAVVWSPLFNPSFLFKLQPFYPLTSPFPQTLNSSPLPFSCQPISLPSSIPLSPHPLALPFSPQPLALPFSPQPLTLPYYTPKQGLTIIQGTSYALIAVNEDGNNLQCALIITSIRKLDFKGRNVI